MTAALFALTAVAEIVGCYLPWLVLKHGRPLWLLVPAAISLALFAWLLTLHRRARHYGYHTGGRLTGMLVPSLGRQSNIGGAHGPGHEAR